MKTTGDGPARGIWFTVYQDWFVIVYLLLLFIYLLVN